MTDNGRLDEPTAKALDGVDELTKLTVAIQIHCEIDATGDYDIAMAEELVKVLNIEIQEELQLNPKLPVPGKPPRTVNFKTGEWCSNRWIGDWRCEHGVVEPPEKL